MTEADKPDATELWGLGPHLKLDHAWAPHPVEGLYRIPVGTDETGRPVEIDFKELALGGMGPHGMIIGATGSGKSELLRTIVLGLMSTHSPADVNFLLAEVMGAGTFWEFKGAPHVSAHVPNLASDFRQGVSRLGEVLEGELNRRQNKLNTVGVKSFWDYRRLRESGDQRCDEPLPALFVVLDEFSEMLVMHPDFADLLVMAGRLGSALGVHLLMDSQRLEKSKIRPFEGSLSYRIALRTFNGAESRATIGVPDAVDLPQEPGFGLLKTNDGNLKQFKAAYVSGWDETERTLIDRSVAEFHGRTPSARQIWLPPLETPPTLDALLPPIRHSDDRGYTAVHRPADKPLQVPVGLLDVPYHHRQEPMLADLDAHGAIVGDAGSGKSTLLTTLVASTALTHTPREVQFYCINLGGGPLAALQHLPHVGCVITDPDEQAIRQTLNNLRTLLTQREQLFRQTGVTGMADFRDRRRRRELPGDPYGDVFLLIDGWPEFTREFETLVPDVHHLASAGSAFGIHLFVTANRWKEIDLGPTTRLSTHVELRLADPGESDVNRKIAKLVPRDQPGFGLHPAKLHFLGALPRVDSAELAGAADVEAEKALGYSRTARPVWKFYNDNHTEAVADLVGRIKRSWRGNPAPKVKTAPAWPSRPDATSLWDLDVDRDWAPRPVEDIYQVPIGADEDGIPVELDFKYYPLGKTTPERMRISANGLILGTDQAEKTELVRTIVLGLMATHSPGELNFVLTGLTDPGIFAPFKDLPHVSALTPVLEEQPDLLVRLPNSLEEEGERRAAILRTSGAKDFTEYHRRRVAGDQRCQEPLPALILIVDGVSATLPNFRKFEELATMTVRAHRVGFNLLVTSHESMLERIRSFESYLHYGISLSAHSSDESSMVIVLPDAFDLPVGQGRGYLRTGSGLKQFRIASLPENDVKALTGRIRHSWRWASPAHRLGI